MGSLSYRLGYPRHSHSIGTGFEWLARLTQYISIGIISAQLLRDGKSLASRTLTSDLSYQSVPGAYFFPAILSFQIPYTSKARLGVRELAHPVAYYSGSASFVEAF